MSGFYFVVENNIFPQNLNDLNGFVKTNLNENSSILKSFQSKPTHNPMNFWNIDALNSGKASFNSI